MVIIFIIIIIINVIFAIIIPFIIFYHLTFVKRLVKLVFTKQLIIIEAI
jgi:hypothetical protein